MEPVIPVNVKEEMLSDASEVGLNLAGPSLENLHNTLTHDEAVAVITRLSDENHQLKGVLNHILCECNLYYFEKAFDKVSYRYLIIKLLFKELTARYSVGLQTI